MNLRDLLLEEAAREGFPLAGALDLGSAPEYPDHVARYDRWVTAGMAGAMSYLERGRDRRADPRLVLPGAKSILCVALPYPRRPAGAPHAAQGPRYARYLQGPDYHEDIAARLERVMKLVRERWTGPELQYKVCVDTSAVLERTWAALAGLGWIGKNTMLIHPRLGSYLFLGEVLLSEPVHHGPAPLKDYCGHCTRCLEGCPAKAITEPRTVDSRKCISYWTLEKRGELPISEEQRRAAGPWIGGCDICQEVCPFNLKPARLEEPAPPRNATDLREWRVLLAETPEEYRERVRDSAMSRIKPPQFSRNLALTLGNAILETAARERASKWGALEPEISRRLAGETDPHAREAWARCAEAVQSPNRIP